MVSNLPANQITCEIKNLRIDRLCKQAWCRLPDSVRLSASKQINHIYDVEDWNAETQKQLTENSRRLWSAAKFNWTLGEICISQKDSQNIPDGVITGAFIHEVAHAFQSHITPNNIDAIEYLGTLFPADGASRRN
jgi:hypothetical protein